MKKFVLFLTSVVLILSLSACSSFGQGNNKGEQLMIEKDNPISDFEKLRTGKLPESKGKHSESDIAKIYFVEIKNLLWTHSLIIDLQNKVMQTDPITGHFFGETDIAPFDVALSGEDVEKIVEILEAGHVEEWEEEYRYGDETMLEQMGGEGYNWSLSVQYKDGTMQRRYGKGTKEAEIHPDGYVEFEKGISVFIEEKSSKSATEEGF